MPPASYATTLMQVSCFRCADLRVDCLLCLMSELFCAVLRVEELPAQPGSATANGTPSATPSPPRRLVQLKTARRESSWKGYYAATDTQHWSDHLRESLGYCSQAEVNTEHDAGMFWIAWADVMDFFSCIHSSWSPARFSCRRDLHGLWRKPVAPQAHLDDI